MLNGTPPFSTNAATWASTLHPRKPRSRLLVVPASVKLVLLDPQGSPKLWVIAAQILNESLGVLAAGECSRPNGWLPLIERRSTEYATSVRLLARRAWRIARHDGASRTRYRWHLVPPFHSLRLRLRHPKASGTTPIRRCGQLLTESARSCVPRNHSRVLIGANNLEQEVTRAPSFQRAAPPASDALPADRVAFLCRRGEQEAQKRIHRAGGAFVHSTR